MVDQGMPTHSSEQAIVEQVVKSALVYANASLGSEKLCVMVWEHKESKKLAQARSSERQPTCIGARFL